MTGLLFVLSSYKNCTHKLTHPSTNPSLKASLVNQSIQVINSTCPSVLQKSYLISVKGNHLFSYKKSLESEEKIPQYEHEECHCYEEDEKTEKAHTCVNTWGWLTQNIQVDLAHFLLLNLCPVGQEGVALVVPCDAGTHLQQCEARSGVKVHSPTHIHVLHPTPLVKRLLFLYKLRCDNNKSVPFTDLSF